MPPTTPPTMGPIGVDEPGDGAGATLELVAMVELVWVVRAVEDCPVVVSWTWKKKL